MDIWIARFFRKRCKEWYSQKWKPGCGYYDAARAVATESRGGPRPGPDDED